MALVPALWDEWQQRCLPDATTTQTVIVGSLRFLFPALGDASYGVRLIAQAQQLLALVEATMGLSEDDAPI
ncbi:hypothetical protein [Microbacterium sp. Leaf159]|uniref:hypothetical protein n=1 Tax=Microbacterium sp. Leaf159 TaxID=1736279 RepID=UPI0006F4A1A0|nr:hypothetical protein [Microbacterium sp. Leaf159]KQR39323.1 hypothetical protein ASF80_07865 [Microbacterium sp. Leaf159]